MKEQMNKDILEYMERLYENQFDCMYAYSWDWLMPVWAKLRPELKPRHYKLDGHVRTDNKGVLLGTIIGNHILDVNIEKAHKNIHEAILWLKNSKK